MFRPIARRIAALAGAVALAPSLFGQAAPPAREKVTFDALHVAATELPKEMQLASELACVSMQPQTLFDLPIFGTVVPAPKRKDSQTIAGAQKRGSILYFEFESAIPSEFMEFIPGYLWGDATGPTKEHPEDLVCVDNVAMILSFPPSSQENQWVRQRLRSRFGLRVAHEFGALQPFVKQIMKCYDTNDPEPGLKLLHDNADKVQNLSFAAYLEGELFLMKKDWDGAEKSYAHALELDATVDPLPNDSNVWAVMDGRGGALYGLKKYDDSVTALRKAAEFAASLHRPTDQARSLYQAACSLALNNKQGEALVVLRDCISLDPKLKAEALKDEDFASIRTTPTFKKITQ